MKKILKILLAIILVWILIFIIDFISIKTSKKPIFVISKTINRDSNSTEYKGLGYKVIVCEKDEDKKVTIGGFGLKNSCEVEVKKTDAEKFSGEYTNVDNTNLFVYRTSSEIINILKNGTGIVYLGFPGCPWCQAYVPYLNEVAKTNGLEKIYYFNILEDRKNNTDDYKEMVSLLKDYLSNDSEGNKRIYAPSIIAVKAGEIVGFDDETGYDTKGEKDPKDYWTDKRVKKLKEKLNKMAKEVASNTCSDCNK